MDLIERLLARGLQGAIRRGSLAVTFASGDVRRFGDGSGPVLAARFTDRRAQALMALDPDLRFGELYMDGRFVPVAGSIRDILGLFYENAEAQAQPWLARVLDAVRFRARRLARSNLPARSRRNVAHHYDLDERLFRLFLDEDMQYSCAYFARDDDTLEQAQAAKKRRLAAKLHLGPGSRVLDIGCGWGGLALTLADAGAGEVLGVSLAEEQIRVARQRASNAGLEDRVRFELTDYRSLEGRFDRIVSIGMFEHVGVNFYRTFFQKAARLLADDGVMVLHTIGSSEAPGFVTPWLDKYIFPGGDIPSLSEIMPHVERAGLIVTDVEVLRFHYALTLAEWARRFQRRRAEAAALYNERLCRMWEFYLAAAECAFLHENLVVFQIQLARSARALPRTRDYMSAGLAARAEASRAPAQA